MNTKVYFDNLPATVTEQELMELFSLHGNVVNVHIVVDRAGHEARSYGFVTMITPEGARAAIQSISGKALGTETVVLSEASPTAETVGLKNTRLSPRRMMSRLY